MGRWINGLEKKRDKPDKIRKNDISQDSHYRYDYDNQPALIPYLFDSTHQWSGPDIQLTEYQLLTGGDTVFDDAFFDCVPDKLGVIFKFKLL